MYHTYIRSHKKQIAENTKTVTRSPDHAEIAFRELMQRREFWCTPHVAVLTLDNRLLEARRFDKIVPSDSAMAKRLAAGDAMPDLPKYLYPEEQAQAAKEKNRDIILCYVDREADDAPILKKSEHVRLLHRN